MYGRLVFHMRMILINLAARSPFSVGATIPAPVSNFFQIQIVFFSLNQICLDYS